MQPLPKMPIFQDDVGGGRVTPPAEPEFVFRCPPAAEPMRRKESEESIRTDLCEGPLLDCSDDHETKLPNDDDVQSRPVSDRVELIERLKRGESPTWVPNRHVCVDINSQNSVVAVQPLVGEATY